MGHKLNALQHYELRHRYQAITGPQARHDFHPALGLQPEHYRLAQRTVDQRVAIEGPVILRDAAEGRARARRRLLPRAKAIPLGDTFSLRQRRNGCETP